MDRTLVNGEMSSCWNGAVIRFVAKERLEAQEIERLSTRLLREMGS